MLRVNRSVKAILAKKRMSALELSKILGINRNTITSNVGEKSNPKLSTLCRYADALDVKVSDIIRLAEEIQEDNSNVKNLAD